MAHQDFERYAVQRGMRRTVSKKYDSFFKENVLSSLRKDFKILDFGCGDGTYFEFFKQFTKHNNIFGVEISQTRVTRCHQTGWHNVFKVNSLEPLPFDDSFFDLINFDQVIEHITINEISFYLNELKRVLADGGLIVMITPNYPIKRFYDLFKTIRQGDIKKIKDDPTHITKYSFRKLRSLLTNFFKILKLEPTGGGIWEKLKYDVFSHKIIGLLQKKHRDAHENR